MNQREIGKLMIFFVKFKGKQMEIYKLTPLVHSIGLVGHFDNWLICQRTSNRTSQIVQVLYARPWTTGTDSCF